MKSSTHYPFCKAGLTLLVGSSLTLPVAAQTGQIDEIAVIGTRGALQNAIEKQRNADKVVGVVDSDALGNFSDINVSESLRRIAGIMVENDQGEGRYVSVRGMNTDLNAMTINGVSTASPEDRRGIMLDGVPTDILSSMTVLEENAAGHLVADVEGMDVYRADRGEVYLVVSSQGDNSYAVYDLNDNHAYKGSFRFADPPDGRIDGVQETDGLSVTSRPLGAAFPRGMLVVQDGYNDLPSEHQNFKLVSWQAIAAALSL